jgi:hypothetical protein
MHPFPQFLLKTLNAIRKNKFLENLTLVTSRLLKIPSFYGAERSLQYSKELQTGPHLAEQTGDSKATLLRNSTAGALFPKQQWKRCLPCGPCRSSMRNIGCQEGAPKRQESNFEKKKSLVKSPRLGFTPRYTDWLTVSRNVILTLT